MSLQKLTVTVLHVSGFRAKVKYQSGSKVTYQDVLIRDKSFRIGDSKYTLIGPNLAQVKTVVTNPATGGTTLENATVSRK